MGKAIRLSEDMVGKKVRMVNKVFTFNNPEVGSIGTITSYDDNVETRMHYCVKWETISHSIWMRDKDIEEVVENNTDMTNDEIWQMLESKIRKNGLVAKISVINTHVDDYPNNEVKIAKAYYEDDVHNAIAIAYRSGYERAMKGRPFKIGEKRRKRGHWVPVDPGNLPEEGTRVRYARETIDYKDHPEFITLGQTGTFARGKHSGNPGMKPDGNPLYSWVSFVNCSSCLDMWVEDDE